MTQTDIPRDMLANWRVVVVDDDPGSLDVAAALLQYHGATVYTAKDGREALGMIRKVNPHFIVTDLSMPVMDGWELIRHLKQDRATLDIPIIALTAHGRSGDRSRAIALGCHNFLNKPLTPYTFIRDLLTLLVDIPDIAIRLQSGLK